MCKFNMFITAVCFLFLIILIHILGRKITEGGKAGRASTNPPPRPPPPDPFSLAQGLDPSLVILLLN